jgi:hypothetical protein
MLRKAILLAFFAVVLGLSACSSGGGCGRNDDDCADFEADSAADAAANAEPSNVAASDVEEPAFDGCTDNCSGHEAGFAWAQSNDVTDSSECGGNSNSFIEGCEAFTEQREQQAQDNAQDAASQDEGESE